MADLVETIRDVVYEPQLGLWQHIHKSTFAGNPIIIIAGNRPENYVNIKFWPNRVVITAIAGLGKQTRVIEYCDPNFIQTADNAIFTFAVRLGLLRA